MCTCKWNILKLVSLSTCSFIILLSKLITMYTMILKKKIEMKYLLKVGKSHGNEFCVHPVLLVIIC